MTLNHNEVEELREAHHLLFLDKTGAAIKLLLKRRRRFPDDAETLAVLAEAYNDQKKFDQARWAAEAALALDPSHLEAATELANSLKGLQRLSEALRILDAALEVYRSNSGAYQKDKKTLRSYNYLLMTRWSILDDLGRHEQALEQALQGEVIAAGRWYSQKEYSLVALSRFDEVMKLRSEDDLAQTLWDIGFTLMFQQRYCEAQDYFLRRFSFAILPQTKHFTYLVALIECSLLCEDYLYATFLCDTWLSRIGSSIRNRCLRSLKSVALKAQGKDEEAAELIRSVCASTSRSSWLAVMRAVRSELHFEAASQRVERLFEEMFHEPGSIQLPGLQE